MSVRVIRAGEGHLEELTPLFDGYRVFYRQPSDPIRARQFIADRLRLADSVIFLAYAEGAPPEGASGFTQLYPSLSSARMQRIWILNDLFVTPSARRKGVGRALIDAAHDHAAQTGAASVSLATERTNEVAKALYREVGYSEVTAFEHYAFPIPGPRRT